MSDRARVVMTIVSGIVALCLSGTSSAESLPAGGECHHLKDPVDWSYCVLRTPGSANRDVLYYFHGIFGDETRWFTEPLNRAIEARWQARGLDAPIVVGINFGKTRLLSAPNGSSLSGLLDVFANQVLPGLDAKYATPGARRLLFGESLGGFNALQAYLRLPEFFSKVALACPAIATIAPQSSAAEIAAYVRRNNANPARVLEAYLVARAHFPTLESWKASDPLLLASQRLGPGSSPLLILGAEHDGYGFYEGDAKFAELVGSLGVSLQWRAAPVGHCHVNADEIADFLAS